jgi:hypothetical protein
MTGKPDLVTTTTSEDGIVTIVDGVRPGSLPTIPSGWVSVDERDLRPSTKFSWEHTESGLEVRVRRQRRPTQLHTPETSSDDTGYVADAVSNELGEQLTHNLSSEQHAYARAYELMLNFPDGEFEPTQRDIEWEGPRSIAEWFDE